MEIVSINLHRARVPRLRVIQFKRPLSWTVLSSAESAAEKTNQRDLKAFIPINNFIIQM